MILGSFIGAAMSAYACDEHKAQAKKTSTQTVTDATTTPAAPVAKDAKKECHSQKDKKECTSQDRKECIEKTGKDCSKDTKASTENTSPCCAKKAPTKKS